MIKDRETLWLVALMEILLSTLLINCLHGNAILLVAKSLSKRGLFRSPWSHHAIFDPSTRSLVLHLLKTSCFCVPLFSLRSKLTSSSCTAWRCSKDVSRPSVPKWNTLQINYQRNIAPKWEEIAKLCEPPFSICRQSARSLSAHGGCYKGFPTDIICARFFSVIETIRATDYCPTFTTRKSTFQADKTTLDLTKCVFSSVVPVQMVVVAVGASGDSGSPICIERDLPQSISCIIYEHIHNK